MLEVFTASHFRLPDLGPIGANGLAEPRDFLQARLCNGCNGCNGCTPSRVTPSRRNRHVTVAVTAEPRDFLQARRTLLCGALPRGTPHNLERYYVARCTLLCGTPHVLSST